MSEVQVTEVNDDGSFWADLNYIPDVPTEKNHIYPREVLINAIKTRMSKGSLLVSSNPYERGIVDYKENPDALLNCDLKEAIGVVTNFAVNDDFTKISFKIKPINAFMAVANVGKSVPLDDFVSLATLYAKGEISLTTLGFVVFEGESTYPLTVKSFHLGYLVLTPKQK